MLGVCYRIHFRLALIGLLIGVSLHAAERSTKATSINADAFQQMSLSEHYEACKRAETAVEELQSQTSISPAEGASVRISGGLLGAGGIGLGLQGYRLMRKQTRSTDPFAAGIERGLNQLCGFPLALIGGSSAIMGTTMVIAGNAMISNDPQKIKAMLTSAQQHLQECQNSLTLRLDNASK